jgi:hypothetical protein
MSGAAARTDLCYSTLIARLMELDLEREYLFPQWPGGGDSPANLEILFRALDSELSVRHDRNQLNLATGILKVLNLILEHQHAEDEAAGGVPFFHNLACWGFNIADSWLLSGRCCQGEVQAGAGIESLDDVERRGLTTVHDTSFYRCALKVLNPSLDRYFGFFTHLDWLDYHVRRSGVENLILSYGLNNVLPALVSLCIRQTRPGLAESADYTSSLGSSHRLWRKKNSLLRKGDALGKKEWRAMEELDGSLGMVHSDVHDKFRWSLWHPDHFQQEFRTLLGIVDELMEQNDAAGCDSWNVFISDIPVLTRLAFLRGRGERTVVDGRPRYEIYTYFPNVESDVYDTEEFLTCSDVVHIESCIRLYNRAIEEAAGDLNERHRRKGRGPRYHLVRLSALFESFSDGTKASVEAPETGLIYPPVNAENYVASSKRLISGGIFSLDALHPSAIGQGLIAAELLKVMKEAGVLSPEARLDWSEIIGSDSLYCRPVGISRALYVDEGFAKIVVDFLQLLDINSRDAEDIFRSAILSFKSIPVELLREIPRHLLEGLPHRLPDSIRAEFLAGLPGEMIAESLRYLPEDLAVTMLWDLPEETLKRIIHKLPPELVSRLPRKLMRKISAQLSAELVKLVFVDLPVTLAFNLIKELPGKILHHFVPWI